MIFGLEFTEWLALLTLAVGVPVSAYAAFRLWKRARKFQRLWVLEERYRWQVGVTVFALIFGLIFMNNDMAVPWLDVETTKWITRLAVLALSVGLSVAWLWKERSARLNKEKGKGVKK